MNKLLKFLSLGLATTLLFACDNSKDDLGKVYFKLSQEKDVIDVVTKSEVSTYTSLPSADDFTLTVKNQNEESITISDLSVPTSLAVGNYTAKASYGSVDEEGFDKPCFVGETSFTVNGGQETEVSVTARLANCIIRLEYTDNFKNYYSDYSFTLTTGSGKVINFPASETRAAFVDAYMVKVSGTLTNQGCKTQSFEEKEYKNLEAAKCYTLKFDASNIGSPAITISFDDSVETVELGEIDLND